MRRLARVAPDVRIIVVIAIVLALVVLSRVVGGDGGARHEACVRYQEGGPAYLGDACGAASRTARSGRD
jgi:hypothetical protein